VDLNTILITHHTLVRCINDTYIKPTISFLEIESTSRYR